MKTLGQDEKIAAAKVDEHFADLTEEQRAEQTKAFLDVAVRAAKDHKGYAEKRKALWKK